MDAVLKHSCVVRDTSQARLICPHSCWSTANRSPAPGWATMLLPLFSRCWESGLRCPSTSSCRTTSLPDHNLLVRLDGKLNAVPGLPAIVLIAHVHGQYTGSFRVTPRRRQRVPAQSKDVAGFLQEQAGRQGPTRGSRRSPAQGQSVGSAHTIAKSEGRGRRSRSRVTSLWS